MNVVVVEDDFDIRYILNYEISDLGFKASCFSSPIEAQEFILANHVDAIVCDYRLPTMDGIEFFDWTKTLSQKIPFILLTGEQNLDSNSLILRGMKKVLFKPRQLTDLKAILNEICTGVLG